MLVTSAHQEKPLVVRSSAEGDARGTGIYKSVFTECTAGSVRKAVQEVLASYFTPSAVLFRRDAQTGEGMGIMIEPLIGQQLQDEDSPVYGPVLSGFGYTSTSQGEGYINVVPGIGGGVETRHTERLTRKMLEPSKGLLQDFISSQRNLIAHGMIAKRESALLRTTRGDMAGDYEGRAYLPTQRSGQYYEKGGVHPTGLDFNRDIFLALHGLDMLPFFEKIEAIEKKIGKPQYFEWAMTFEGRKPKFWVIQIADVNKKYDSFDFEDFGDYFIAGHTATGTGIVDTDTVVCCGDPARLDELHAFNQNHKGYVLFYTGDLISRGKNEFRAMHRGRELQYDDINNASVIIE